MLVSYLQTSLSTEPLKLALVVEAKAWKTAYGHSLNARYRASMENIVQFVTEYSKRLARPIKVHTVQETLCEHVSVLMSSSQDLEDGRSTMATLEDVRAAEIEMDMELGPIEECYAFLQRCRVAVPREEIERVDSLRYTFKNLQSQAVSRNPTELRVVMLLTSPLPSRASSSRTWFHSSHSSRPTSWSQSMSTDTILQLFSTPMLRYCL